VHAVVIRNFGPPEVLEPAEVDEVRAGPDDAVIDVELANVTFVETQIRAGRPPHPSMLPALPAILGNGRPSARPCWPCRGDRQHAEQAIREVVINSLSPIPYLPGGGATLND